MTVVNEETSKVEANIEPQKKAERVDRMDQLKTMLRTSKGKVTKSLNKMEPAVVLFEKYEKEKSTAKKIDTKQRNTRFTEERI